MITRVFYQSRKNGSFGRLNLLWLQRQCRGLNQREKVTSFLFHDETRIFQVVEGSAMSVRGVMNRVRRSALHQEVEERAVLHSDARGFTGWPFGATSVSDTAYTAIASQGGVQDFFDLDVMRAAQLLERVAQDKQSALAADIQAAARGNFAPGRSPRDFRTLTGAAPKPQPPEAASETMVRPSAVVRG